ncbi:DUF397 domain-containing protein [Streptomyces sp. D2-8]|nr:DUF397 domain-containing protein [Streptomyces sp. D2-8]
MFGAARCIIRDSKTPDGPVLLVGRSAWSAFIGSVR